MVHGKGRWLYEVAVLRHVQTGITIELTSNSGGGFRYSPSDNGTVSYLFKTCHRDRNEDWICGDAVETIRRAPGKLPILNASLITSLEPPKDPNFAIENPEMAIEGKTVWAAISHSSVIKIQHRNAADASAALYISPVSISEN